jgi:uncharacterized membrane protein
MHRGYNRVKKEKIEKMRSMQQGKKMGETIRTFSLINLFIIGGGLVLVMLNMNPVTTKIGNGLVIAGAILVILTVVFQIILTVKMRKERKK